MELERIERALGSVARGRRWIVNADVAAAAALEVDLLRRWGAVDVMVVSASPGVGDQPECRIAWVDTAPATSIMDGLRSFHRAVAEPAPSILNQVTGFDPSGDALVAASVFDVGQSCFGRRLYGARARSWAALEDKVAIEQLWDRAGVARVVSAVADRSEVVRVARSLDQGAGTVWAVDNSRGWHGGAEGTRWVGPEPADVRAASDWLEPRGRMVRVMPFLEGVPCSIHGFVTDRGVATFRPIELMVFRTPDREFVYGGVGGTWDAPDALATEMRDAARRVGDTLADDVGYRGAFSIDGVATTDGFRPTELNPRVSVGLMIQTAAVEGLAIWAVTRALIEGDLDIDPEWLERTVLAAAGESRRGRLGLVTFEQVEPAQMRVAFEGSKAVAADPDHGIGTLSVGPSPVGSVVFFRFDPGAEPWGELLAPYAASAARLAADTWGFRLPSLGVAPQVADVTPSGGST